MCCGSASGESGDSEYSEECAESVHQAPRAIDSTEHKAKTASRGMCNMDIRSGACLVCLAQHLSHKTTYVNKERQTVL